MLGFSSYISKPVMRKFKGAVATDPGLFRGRRGALILSVLPTYGFLGRVSRFFNSTEWAKAAAILEGIVGYTVPKARRFQAVCPVCNRQSLVKEKNSVFFCPHCSNPYYWDVTSQKYESC